MRFLPLFLYGNQQVGSDQLNNAVYELVQTGKSEGRFSSWTAEEIALDKREVTLNNKKIITRASKATLQQVEKVKIDGMYYSIQEIKGDGFSRWRILIVNRYGSESLENRN